MASIIEGYNYDIFISYRQKDNKGDRWVSEFVDALKDELESTFKEDISVYFDENPHDRLQETHNVDKSLEGKLISLILIPVLSQTYCDPKSYAWQSEFLPFIKMAENDNLGKDVRLRSGNVASRILPVRIHDLEAEDVKLFEEETGSVLRALDFVFKTSAGVNRPLTEADSPDKNLNKTLYRDQINKTANAIKEIISGLKTEITSPVNEKPQHTGHLEEVSISETTPVQVKAVKKPSKKVLAGAGLSAIILITALITFWPKIFKQDEFKDLREKDGRISVAVMPFKNMTGDSLYNNWEDSFQSLLINQISGTPELSVCPFETMLDIIGSTGHRNYASITPVIAREIAAKLESGTIITGSLAKAGGNFRINIQLSGTESSEIYKAFTVGCREENDFFIMADSLSVMLKNFLRIETMKSEVLQGLEMPLNTNSPEAYMCFIQALKSMVNNNLSQCKNYLEEALKIDPDFFDCYYVLSTTCYTLGRYEEAMTYWSKAEGYSHILSVRDKIYNDAFKYGYLDKNPQKGLVDFYQLAETEPQNRLLLNSIGDLNRVIHNWDKEIEAYEKYIEIDIKWGVMGKWYYPYMELGDAYHIKGNHKREAELYNEVLNIVPDNRAIFFRQARCALSLGDTARANGLITKIVSSWNFSEVQLKRYLGDLYSEAGIPDKAEVYYRQAFNLNQENPSIKNILARFLIENDQGLEEGIDLVNQVLESNPDNYNFQFTKGLGLLKQGHYNEAMKLLEESWNLRPAYLYDHYIALQEARKAVAKQKN
ncbi:MAG: hypothetical protein IH592_10400 [Bacteroidales bacterium]|nr:hypothetical protein [Bacteroidales bacterium]